MARSSNIVPFRRRRKWTRARDYPSARPAPKKRAERLFPLLLVALPLGAFTAVFLWDGPPPVAAFQRAPDREQSHFALCSGMERVDCIVDGDTFWYRGEKIRIADINTPEASDPQCAEEAQLARRATSRLQTLLNDGAFTLAPNPDSRAQDTYGRSLHVVTRNGRSLGDQMVSEGLAERWRGYRREWC